MTTIAAIDDGLAQLASLSAKFCVVAEGTSARHHQAPQIALEAETARVQAEHYAGAPDAPYELWRPSYDALTATIVDQWHALIDAGFAVHPWLAPGEPYRQSVDMRSDLRQRWLYYLPTAAAGELPSWHPMGEYVLVGTPDGVRTMLLNDVFRAVHDAFGHGGGASFGPKGERQAWAAHRATLPEAAWLALWNETTGQNLWTNYGPHMWLGGGLLATIPLRERPFAPQRIVDVPAEWL